MRLYQPGAKLISCSALFAVAWILRGVFGVGDDVGSAARTTPPVFVTSGRQLCCASSIRQFPRSTNRSPFRRTETLVAAGRVELIL